MYANQGTEPPGNSLQPPTWREPTKEQLTTLHLERITVRDGLLMLFDIV